MLESRLAPATLTVNTLADNTTDTTVLTLRDAITLVNNAGNPSSLGQGSMPSGWASQINTTNAFGTQDTILFDSSLDSGGPANLHVTVTPTNDSTSFGASAFVINTPMTIQGPFDNNGITL